MVLVALANAYGHSTQTHNVNVSTERSEFQGPRILAIFLYLSDVEERFFGRRWGSGPISPPRAVVAARNGPGATVCCGQALPVTQGVKYEANVRLHQRDTESAPCLAEQGLEKNDDEWTWKTTRGHGQR